MTYKRVRVGAKYRYYPVMIDKLHPPKGEPVSEGDIVEVVNMRGCPPANTMGHCYIAKNDKFVGLVCTNSLRGLREKAEVKNV